MRRLYYNGKFYLQAGEFAEAVLCEGERILRVGTAQELLPLPAQERTDLEGRTVLPGLNDSHCHICALGAAGIQVDIKSCASVEELIGTCREYLEAHPGLCKDGLRSMGWNQDLFPEGARRIPTKEDLDKISADVPVLLERVCGHVCCVNSKLMELAGIDRSTPAPSGGTIEKGEDGELSGIFTENAVPWLESLFPPYSPEVKKAFTLRALDYAKTVGLTSVQSNDVGGPNTYGQFRLFRELYEEGLAPVRFRHQICFDTPEEMDEFLETEAGREIYRGTRLKLGPVKLLKDGSLGGYTATLREGYAGDRSNHGVSILDNEEMDTLVQAAAARGLQVITHVIGDRALEETLDAYAKVCPGDNPLRHGLVHCQITDRPLLERIADMDLTVFYQPVFLDYDMHILESRVGKALAETSYAFKTAQDLGIRVSYGTDAPVEDLNPFPNLCAAVTRQDSEGFPEGGFYPQEKVSLVEAIDAYTIGSAYCEFQEQEKGRIREGFLADFTVLDRDIFRIPPAEIARVQVALTIVGGEIVYRAP